MYITLVSLANEIKDILKLNSISSRALAINKAQKLFEQHPNHFDVGKVYAFTLVVGKSFERAVEILNKLLKINSKDYDVLNNLGKAYMELEDFEESEKYLLQAISIKKNGIFSYANLGELYLRLGEFQKSKNNFDIFFELSGGHETVKGETEIKGSYADVLLALGEREKAKKTIENFIKHQFDANLYFYLLNMDKNYGEAEEHEKLLKYLQSQKYPTVISQVQHLAPIYFALARFYEKKNDDKSEEYYYEGNKIISLAQRFNAIEIQKQIKTIKKNYKYIKNNIPVDVNQKNGENIVFITGLPRSGTTLLESIIAKHEHVKSGGEMLSMLELCKIFSDPKINTFNKDDFHRISETYLKRTNFIRKKKKIFIDKLPANYFYIGLIKLCLPSAKFIILQRNFWDIAISQFRQYYLTNVPYSTKFFNIALEAANFEHISNFWSNQPELENNIIKLKYEDLVNDEEYFANSIYNFLGIIEKYEKSGRENFFSRTASRFEIKKTVDSSSVGKKFFENSKDDFFKDLENQREYWQRQS